MQPILIDTLIKITDVQRQTLLGKSTIYALINKDLFPKPVKIGRSSRWSQRQIDALINGGENT